jgi:cytochrome c553
MRRFLLLIGSLALPFASSCALDHERAEDGGPAVDAGHAAVDASAAGLPCDVSMLLSMHCTSCHGTTPTQAAPMSLVTYADLARAAITDPTQSEAALSVMRIQNHVRPMPPAPAAMLSTADVAVLSSWVAAGMPPGSCEMGTDPFALPPTCTSGTHWTGGTRGSSRMEPGRACIACHAMGGEGPRYAIAGTVYATGHEPDDCNGAASSAGDPITVHVTDASGNSVALNTNSAGNFYSRTRLTPPYTVSVERQGRVRPMVMPAPSGDCNTCHTQDGTMSAPGRIVAP